MAKKTVIVHDHVRSTPSNPAWKGTGNKPGPKNVKVDTYKRSKP